jgi:penicillin-binding protein 1C
MLKYRQFSPRRRRRLLPRLIKLAVIGFISFAFVSVLIFAWVSRDLPQPDKIVRREGFATQIYDRQGKLIYDIYAGQKRTPVNLAQVPTYLKDATVAIEDKDFYQHHGFDFSGYLRSVRNLAVYHHLTGGSTLTQQLVKNVLLTSERTLVRKIKEFILAVQIEREYGKDEILTMYLNEAPYGGTAWGIEAAAENYFGKDAKDLTLVETVVLAGLPQRPSYYSPFGPNTDAYIWRAEQVLRRMREDGYIDNSLEEKTKKELPEVKFASPGASLKAPHFIFFVKNILEGKYGQNLVEKGGLKVTTTLDLDLQEAAQKTVSEEIKKVEKLNITNGGAIVLGPKTGEILAMVGSKDYNDPHYDGKVNVVLATRQPGSAIKPITYLTAFRQGYSAASLVMDTKTAFPGGDKPEYVPENYDGKEHGPLGLRYALGNSINIAAVKTLARIGVRPMLQTAYDMGLKTLEPTGENLKRLGLSVTLGGGEVRLLDLAAAYCAFANEGKKIEPVAILKVEDQNNKILEELKEMPGDQVITPEQAFLISNILSDNSARLLTFGEHSALNIPDATVAVKTGTTNDKRDNWTIGWTPSVLVGVWVGNNDNSSMKEVASGVSGAAPIWRKILLKALERRPAEEFTVPEGIVTAEVDSVSGYRSHDGFPSRIEYFVKGTEPSESEGDDPVHVKLKVCHTSGKLATPVDIARGDYDEKEYFIFKEDDPTAAPSGPNKWQEGIDKWLQTQSDSRYHPPTEYCETQNQVEVKIDEPSDKAQVGNDFKIKLEPVSANEIVQVEIFVNGESKGVLTSQPYERILTLGNGSYTLKAKARDSKGNEGEREIKIGVNVPWNYSPSPTPTPSPTPIPSPTPSPRPTLFFSSPTPSPALTP